MGLTFVLPRLAAILLLACVLLPVVLCQTGSTTTMDLANTTTMDLVNTTTMDLANTTTMMPTTRPTARPRPTCFKQTINIDVFYQGCESNRTSVKVCAGTCGSISLITSSISQPLSFQCNCCSAIAYQVKVTRIMFRCGPNRDLQEKRIFLPRVRDCGCVSCIPTL